MKLLKWFISLDTAYVQASLVKQRIKEFMYEIGREHKVLRLLWRAFVSLKNEILMGFPPRLKHLLQFVLLSWDDIHIESGSHKKF